MIAIPIRRLDTAPLFAAAGSFSDIFNRNEVISEDDSLLNRDDAHADIVIFFSYDKNQVRAGQPADLSGNLHQAGLLELHLLGQLIQQFTLYDAEPAVVEHDLIHNGGDP